MAQRLLLFGTDEPAAPALPLTAGRLSALLRGTRLGPIRYDGHEVWHGIDFLFRDADWGTPAPMVDSLVHHSDTDAFRAELRGHIDAGSATISFDIRIEADEDGLRYEATAHADADVLTNRTGLVLMHPLQACGRPVEVTHTDGRTSSSTLPTLIAPWPPFTLVRAIRHAYADEAWAACRFSGEDFELEDQRNNADASFKTYCRSNLMPRPYLLRAGMVVRQAVLLEIESPPAKALATTARPVQVRVGDAGPPLPAIGVGISPADVDAPPTVRAALAALAPALLHLSLDANEAWVNAHGIADLLAVSGACSLRLDIANVDPAHAPSQIEGIAASLRTANVVPASVLALPSVPPVTEAARRAFPASRIGAGTPHFFTQLNRIEDLAAADFLSFTTASVVHGADDAEIMAGLRSLPAMVETLRFRHGPLPVHVGPSSIGARQSPLGAQPASDGTRRLALSRRDPRTRGLFGAAWALGYVARFAQAGAKAVTLFGLQGDAALIENGLTTPAHELLRCLGRPARCRALVDTDADSLAALALEREGRTEILLANLGEAALDVQLSGLALPDHALLMDATALQARGNDADAPCCRPVPLQEGRLTLPPYALAFA